MDWLTETAVPTALDEAGASLPSERHWSGPFGERYARQFEMEPAELDEHWLREWGVKRSELVKWGMAVMGGGPASILEVGCNVGNQLAMLSGLYPGRTLTGLELNPWAAKRARERGFAVHEGTMRKLPFADGAVDCVLTCGVVSHIETPEVPGVMAELGRVARRWYFGTEYRGPEPYGDGFVWCRDHCGEFLKANPGWRVAWRRGTAGGAGSNALSMEAFVCEREGAGR